MTRLRSLPACLCLVVLLAAEPLAQAQSAAPGPLPLEGETSADGSTVTLTWPRAERQITGLVQVNRRVLGDTGPGSWRPIGPPRPTAFWRDTNVPSGTAFEYQVIRRQGDIVDAGYWIAGREVPARAERGVALLVVDEEIAEGIGLHLDRFRRDLVGSGWTVIESRAPRHAASDGWRNLAAATAIRGWIIEQVARDPFADHALVLVGHVPVLRSGQAAPDGHEARPHPTDTVYADVDGRWRASRDGLLLHNSVPGDGIELQVGRIDFAPMAAGDRVREIRLLQQYFDKNHHWRHGLMGDPRTAYAGHQMLAVEEHGLYNLVGAGAVAQSGHHYTEPGATEAWLWGVDFGSRHFDDYFEAGGGSSGRSVFAINFGSYKQMFDDPRNAMVALLAQPWTTVAVGWGGRPAWRLHLMALGGTIGEVHRRTVNNGPADGDYPDAFEYFPTGNHVFRVPVWVNLLGDPTLAAYPLAPPVAPTLRLSGDTGFLDWGMSPDPDVQGYRVFEVVGDGSRAHPLDARAPTGTAALTFGTAGGAAGVFLLRAFGLKETPAGSFQTYSQGAYVSAGAAPLPETVTVAAEPGAEVFVPMHQMADGRSLLISVVRPPETGRLTPETGGWRYTPAAGAAARRVVLPITVFDGTASRSASLVILPD